MTTTRDLSIWDGDGLPDTYQEWYDYITELDMTMPEVEGWMDACKREAWVREQAGKYEDKELNITLARYFWRRYDKLNEYKKLLIEQLDRESANQ